MKIKLILVALLATATIGWWSTGEQRILPGQDPSNWGNKIRLGTQFLTTDSLELRDYFVDDSLYTSGQDTLYSDALAIGDLTNGIFTIKHFLENLDGSSVTDSVTLYIRLGHSFYYFNTSAQRNQSIKWDAWKDVGNTFGVASDQLDGINIAQSDSSWWSPATMRQYMIVMGDADLDSSRVWLTDYVR